MRQVGICEARLPQEDEYSLQMGQTILVASYFLKLPTFFSFITHLPELVIDQGMNKMSYNFACSLSACEPFNIAYE